MRETRHPAWADSDEPDAGLGRACAQAFGMYGRVLRGSGAEYEPEKAQAEDGAGDGPAEERTWTPVLRRVWRLPQHVPWTGQPGRTTGLERLGFYGDTWAALRSGLRAAL